MSQLSKSINKYHNQLLAAVIVVIILMFMFVWFRLAENAQPTQEQNQQSNFLASPTFGNLVEVSDASKLQIGNKTIVFPEGWSIVAGYENTQNSLILCEAVTSQSDCRIYLVSKGEDTFYVTTPVFLKSEVEMEITNSIKTIVLAGQETDFNYNTLVLESRTNDEANAQSTEIKDQTIYFQIYGCLPSSNICVSTLKMDVDFEKNAAQTASFEQFVRTLQII